MFMLYCGTTMNAACIDLLIYWEEDFVL